MRQHGLLHFVRNDDALATDDGDGQCLCRLVLFLQGFDPCIPADASHIMAPAPLPVSMKPL
jgi:hypothetical protein